MLVISIGYVLSDGIPFAYIVETGDQYMFNKSNNRKYIVLILAVFFAGEHILSKRLSSLQDYNFGQQNLNSLNVSNLANRSTVLPKAVIKDLKAKKEVNVLLNDPAMPHTWGLKQTQVQKAWSISQGSKEIVVAVIDTGIDINHEDIKNNLWKNPNPTKGDIHGWNFARDNNDLSDNHGHGTHIAGIIGAEGGNGKGISGVAPQVSLMILKYYDPSNPGADNLKNTIHAIHYAIDHGAHIINYSGGGLEYSAEERAAIERARRRGILFVAAAGNEKSNSDVKKYYPADYDLDNIISVTALDQKTRVLPSSNYGTETVDIAAPGNNIYSTLPNGRYGYMTGTSQATAFVSGVAALILAHHKEYKPFQVAKYLKNTGDIVDSLKTKTQFSRKLNSYRALSILDRGVGATGVIATNNVSNSFNPSTGSNNNSESLNNFAQSLLKNIE